MHKQPLSKTQQKNSIKFVLGGNAKPSKKQIPNPIDNQVAMIELPSVKNDLSEVGETIRSRY